MADYIGQRLGNYRLTRLLGQGSFAEVYLGEHIHLGTTVAIKVLSTQVASEDRAQFQQEARILASLKYPHIVRILDFGVEGRTPYLMMDYAPNGTLRTLHPKGTVLPVATVVEYVKQMAQALQYAHDRKVVHRDIKPENMLIGEHNEILLSDFGIALIAQSSRHQSTKDMAGTIAYMAPEQISAHPRRESDQYSLGVVAYEWLCGTRPFHGSYTEIAIKHSIMPPPSLRQHLPTLSPDVEHVVLTALAKQPENRFISVSAFATALEQASQDALATERLRSPGLLSKTTDKPTSSRRTILIAGVVAIATVGAGTTWLVVTQQQHPVQSATGTSTATSTSISTGTSTLTPTQTSSSVGNTFQVSMVENGGAYSFSPASLTIP
jgi:serine/threonine protein kinase